MKQEEQQSQLEESLSEASLQAIETLSEELQNVNGNLLAEDDPLELLRELLLDHYRNRLHELESETIDAQQKLKLLEHRFNDTDLLTTTISPIIASSIQNKIRESPHEMIDAISPIIADAVRSSIAESQDSMVEALYPIMGKLVQRSVSEAMRDLARKIDEQMRTTFDFASILRRLRAMVGLAPSSESVLRDLLPFQVEEIFLIHKETGILLLHQSVGNLHTDEKVGGRATEDNHMIGSMMTAIRDFVNDVLGRGAGEQLTQVEYGDKLILLEAAHFCYLAVVITGVEAAGFRAQMRDVIFDIDKQYLRHLRDFAGDTLLFAPVSKELKTLFSAQD